MLHRVADLDARREAVHDEPSCLRGQDLEQAARRLQISRRAVERGRELAIEPAGERLQFFQRWHRDQEAERAERLFRERGIREKRFGVGLDDDSRDQG